MMESYAELCPQRVAHEVCKSFVFWATANKWQTAALPVPLRCKNTRRNSGMFEAGHKVILPEPRAAYVLQLNSVLAAMTGRAGSGVWDPMHGHRARQLRAQASALAPALQQGAGCKTYARTAAVPIT